MNRRNFIFAAAGTALALTTASSRAAAVNTINDGLALQGYDPVAYFTDGKPVDGDEAITAMHEGATYRFASAQNRDLFVSNPDKYAPAYGGFCAYAAARGYQAPIDPTAFTVVDGRLYLNYSKRVRGKWEEDIPGNLKKSEKNWGGLEAAAASKDKIPNFASAAPVK